ncbi:hypothetical protein HY29_03225 [Hyphomonas beringensis]|uniref:Uncharacterized protein n=1 Tax=Hyphomonas beringensis TaxID=1280946 RepID=A0A062U8N0_9PROT|nr:hypothetical protein [Hyphomonas beringensis]KCZ54098.1 hypothetical protein HY29_03225 [Hyphomonas beringensis]
MLNWLKNQAHTKWADVPASQDGETLIHASAQEIYEKLDFSSPGNALRERGFKFGPGNPAYRIYELTDPDIPESRLIFEVIEAQPGKRYAYRVLRYVEGNESPVSEAEREYTIEPAPQGGHFLHLKETSTLEENVHRDEYVLARAQLNFRVFRNLARLKLHVELGADAASFK